MFNTKKRQMKCKMNYILYNWHQSKKIVILTEKMMIGKCKLIIYKKI